jgi:O-antigen/teichoic acid export membrane protein
MLTDFVALVDQRSVPLFLGAFVGAFATGLYSMARRVVDLGLQAFVAAIGQVATPTFSRLQTDSSRMRAIYLNTIQSVAALSLPMFGLAAVLAEQVVLVFLGPKWIAGAGVLALVSVAALIRSYGWISVSVLIALGRARLRLALQLASLSLSLLALFTLWPGGILAVVKGFVVQAAVMHVLIVLAVRGCLKVALGDYLRVVGPVFLAAGGAVGAALAAKWMLAGPGGPLVTLVVASAAGLLVHGAIIRMLVPTLVERLLGYARELSAPLAGPVR